MKVDVLLGLQWGDEGKGKIVDVLTENYDTVARFQGGPNAGHSLEFNNIKHVLHLIPSGIFHKEKINIIGNGVVLDPAVFLREILSLEKLGVNARQNLYISKKTHLIVPTHRVLDAASEASKGKNKIGSTLKGIGPAYMDKTGRNGLRVGDILANDFTERYNRLLEKHLKLLKQFDFKFNLKEFEQNWFEGIELIKEFRLIDSEHEINNLLHNKQRILAEGAQGTLLDIDFGSYPFVTSSNTVTAGACIGLGISPKQIGEVFGIFKAYCTRVGSGPFPTELNDSTGELMREVGKEFGATTGRPRRCGWLDLVALKYAVMINGVTRLIITKVDVLNNFKTLKVGVNYIVENKKIDHFPYEITNDLQVEYKEFKGWNCNLDLIKSANDFPIELKNYMKFVENELNVPIYYVSTGPDRTQIFRLLN